MLGIIIWVILKRTLNPHFHCTFIIKFFFKIFRYTFLYIVLPIKTNSPVANDQIHPHTNTIPPRCFILGFVFLILNSSFFFRRTILRPSDQKMLNLLSSLKTTPFHHESSLKRNSFANFNRFFD